MNAEVKTVAAGLVLMAREEAGLSQRELAERAGVAQSEIARIESGKREPSIPTLQRILAGAGVELRFRLAPVDDHDQVLAVSSATTPQSAESSGGGPPRTQCGEVRGERKEALSPARPELSAEDILAALNAKGVRYVVIGAFAAIAQGAPIEATYDIDVTPQREPENLQRLSDALDDLDEGLPFSHDARSLAGVEMLNLTCAAGDFDIVFTPAGTRNGYDDLSHQSVIITVGSQQVRAASLADVVRSKEEAGREKDIRVLPALRRFIRGST